MYSNSSLLLLYTLYACSLNIQNFPIMANEIDAHENLLGIVDINSIVEYYEQYQKG